MTTDTEKSEIEKRIGTIAPDQLAGLKSVVDAEAERRSGEAARVHTMNPQEFAEYSQRTIDEGDKARRARDAAANAERHAIHNRNKFGSNG